jgi:predicted flavoprotein YhiN
VISEYGIEGSLIYALSRQIRETIGSSGACTLYLDLLPDHSAERVQKMLARPRNGRSLSDILRRLFMLSAVKTGLIYELAERTRLADADYLAKVLKQLPLGLKSPRPIAEAISSAGGVTLPQLDGKLMLTRHPGIFIAGEMLDWEAPTGGYLLSASMASGRLAGLGAVEHLKA